MDIFPSHFLNGGPDIFFVGSSTYQTKGRKARVIPDKGFIYTIKPNEEGSKLQTFNPSEGHVTRERDFIDLMFDDPAEVAKAKATDADPYAERTLRNMAMEAGNIYGRSGYMRGSDGKEYAVVWVWNLPANSQTAVKNITEKLGFIPEETMLLWNNVEEGLVSDFASKTEPQEEKKEDEDLARLHLATGLEKAALQSRMGRTADLYRKHGIRPYISPSIAKEMDKMDKKEPALLGHYWQKGKEEDIPYLGKYSEGMTFKEFINQFPN